ncbi:Sau3AI family type II restriction endonuclease [Romboutsia lituseburensis]|uniref:Sau3AI family type II restriction endonuclease n=1 Tax=Romboutsia lituseburensis TaxID=1537 RepID=UPI00215B6BF7|nr:Sau3AI family type II restriction endonuclease [Romboutsia lituseburensis]MCR8743904.1 Sau3AI family type II restriction endonuclease [Romboutsia lituseburensis]
MKFKTEEELLNFTKNIIGKKFIDIDTQKLLATNKKDKGILGKVVETGFYGYELNSNPEADFGELGIELKVSGFKTNKNSTISAKERLVLSMIDYSEIIDEEFEFSKLIFKNKKILIIWYEYDYENKDNYGEFVIKHYQLYNMGVDEEVLKNDFNIIKSKVLKGEAHLLSEGDTSYLGACTKGAKGTDTKTQPKSNILAKPRAFSLKNGYITGILRSIDISSQVLAKYKTAQEYIYEKLKPYIGMTQKEIWEQVSGIVFKEGDAIPKNLNKMISDRIIGKDKELGKIDDVFNKVIYEIKNLPVDKDNYPLERLSFKNLHLEAFEYEWNDSEWKDYFEEISFIVITYEGSKKSKNGERVLKDVKNISFTQEDIDLFGKSYNMVREAIKSKDISKLPYPKSYENQILEIAPKGVKGDDAYNNFFKGNKTCFMMDKDFVSSKIN